MWIRSFPLSIALCLGFASFSSPVESRPARITPPSIPSVPDARLSAEYRVILGVKKAREGDWRGAIEDYNRALRLDPDFAVAYNNRGKAYAELGETRKAIEDYNRALRLDPNLAVAYNNRGAAYFQLGEFPQAIEDYNRALRLDPNYAQAYFARGLAYRQLGELQKTREDWQKAADLFQQQGNLEMYGQLLQALQELPR